MSKCTIIPETGFVRLPQILTVFPVSKSAWWAGVKSGIYPPSVKLAKRCTAWKATDIHDLITSHSTPSINSKHNNTKTSNKEKNHA